MVKSVKLILFSTLIHLSVITQVNAAKINGVFFEQNCNWYASEENNSQSFIALLYLSEASKESLNIPFFITFIINEDLTATYRKGWDHQLELNVDGISYTVEGSLDSRPGMFQFVLSPAYFEQINKAMKSGNALQVKGLENISDQYFSLKGYTKTSVVLNSPCDKQ